ncbi:hypothetical protein [Actinomyces bowdenii]|uniref:hypothetical protein n=1 Tax=Actinomyces bowdenii TaxID=131109 RepID=UPI002ADDDCC1|nr:hypothetical protein [Actinomyces bowdenii]
MPMVTLSWRTRVEREARLRAGPASARPGPGCGHDGVDDVGEVGGGEEAPAAGSVEAAEDM